MPTLKQRLRAAIDAGMTPESCLSAACYKLNDPDPATREYSLGLRIIQEAFRVEREAMEREESGE